MRDHTYDLIVIGAGPGGIEASLQGAGRGLRTAIISNTKIGGRATWSSLIPSKVWLAAAEKMDALRHLSAFGLRGHDFMLDLEGLRRRIAEQSEAAANRYRLAFEHRKVTVYYGTGHLGGPNTVLVSEDGRPEIALQARYIIIASGSGPLFFPDLKPNMDHIIAPKLSPKLPKVPESLIMAGGGVTGSEYAYAFAALGARVTILQNSGQLLPRLDPEVSDAFENHLHEKYGIEVCKGDAVKAMRQEGETVIATTAAGKEYRAEYGFIAIGRKADLSILEGSEVALDLTPRQTIRVDVYGQTSVPSIYAIGDVTGVPMMANRATLQARVAVNHLTGRETDLPPNSHYIEAAYTNPPIGQIGDMTVSEESMVVHKPLASLLKAHLLEEAEGMLKINVERKSGRILGAAGFGAHMTDLLAVFQVAMNHGLTYREITAAPFAHPSISEVISQET